jgi:hypothetical protein
MRGAFAVVLFSMVGAAGCGDAAADIPATQHGKRLTLVAGDDTPSAVVVDSLSLTAVDRTFANTSPEATPLYRDVAGVVLVDPTSGDQHLEQWLLTHDGTELRERTCPVKATGGVAFAECGPWGGPQEVTNLGLGGFHAIRSFSSYVFTDSSQNQQLAEVVYNMAGDQREERTCRISGPTASWTDCTTWLAHAESASDLGAPQQTAFEDEIVVPFSDDKGAPRFTQQLITPEGDSVWARSCPTADGEIPGLGASCAFSQPVPVSALGIHFDAVQGAGGYSYMDGGVSMYAQTVIAADGISAARRLCPVTSEGVAFGKCLGWAPVDLTDLSPGSTL